MKALYTALILIFLCGCSPDAQVSSYVGGGFCFTPASVTINRLSEISMIDDYNNVARIKLFIDVADSFGDNMKAPGVFRLELYEYRNLSAENIGVRIYDWPEIDLSDSTVNQSFWQDSLRSYMFSLDIDRKLEKTAKYVVLVTFISGGGQLRFTNTRTIEYYGK